MNKLNWGIIATGNICRSMAGDLNLSKQSTIIAVASRSKAKAVDFAKQYNIKKAYASYEALYEDREVDIVYIGTPNNCHYENIMDALAHGKHVLCEKPLALNHRQARECIEYARQQKLFLMEGVWTSFFPIIKQVKSLVTSNKLGLVEKVAVNFSIKAPYEPSSRLFNPEQGGGALLDIGIYPLNMAYLLLGLPEKVSGTCVKTETGVDMANEILLEYPNQVTAELKSSFAVEKPLLATIYCQNGRIEVADRFICPTQASVLDKGGCLIETIEDSYCGEGYLYEISHVEKCLSAGLVESPVVNHESTLNILKMMDTLRASWQIDFPSIDNKQ